MHSLQGIERLELKFGSAVDRRTIGKVLSAGAALTGDGAAPSERHALQDLQIALTESTTTADQVCFHAPISMILY
jgi:hypothetical protein